MDLPKGFTPNKKCIDKTTKRLLKKPQINLEEKLDDVKIERSERVIKERQGKEWIQDVSDYIKKNTFFKRIVIKSDNWSSIYFFRTFHDTPPEVRLFEKRTEFFKRKYGYVYFSDTDIHKVITIPYDKDIECYDKNYEKLAIKLAKKFDKGKIIANY